MCFERVFGVPGELRTKSGKKLWVGVIILVLFLPCHLTAWILSTKEHCTVGLWRGRLSVVDPWLKPDCDLSLPEQVLQCYSNSDQCAGLIKEKDDCYQLLKRSSDALVEVDPSMEKIATYSSYSTKLVTVLQCPVVPDHMRWDPLVFFNETAETATWMHGQFGMDWFRDLGGRVGSYSIKRCLGKCLENVTESEYCVGVTWDRENGDCSLVRQRHLSSRTLSLRALQAMANNMTTSHVDAGGDREWNPATKITFVKKTAFLAPIADLSTSIAAPQFLTQRNRGCVGDVTTPIVLSSLALPLQGLFVWIFLTLDHVSGVLLRVLFLLTTLLSFGAGASIFVALANCNNWDDLGHNYNSRILALLGAGNMVTGAWPVFALVWLCICYVGLMLGGLVVCIGAVICRVNICKDRGDAMKKPFTLTWLMRDPRQVYDDPSAERGSGVGCCAKSDANAPLPAAQIHMGEQGPAVSNPDVSLADRVSKLTRENDRLTTQLTRTKMKLGRAELALREAQENETFLSAELVKARANPPAPIGYTGDTQGTSADPFEEEAPAYSVAIASGGGCEEVVFCGHCGTRAALAFCRACGKSTGL